MKLLIDLVTGRLISCGTVLADDAATRFDIVDLGRTPQWDLENWDPVTRSLVPAAPFPPSRTMVAAILADVGAQLNLSAAVRSKLAGILDQRLATLAE